MDDAIDLSARPTPDQVARFRKLTPEERYRWLVDIFATLHGLASARTKERWRALKQAQSGGFLSVAAAFVRALNRGDFAVASRLLSDGCVYHGPTGELTGDAIVDAYRATHEWTAGSIERVIHRSRLDVVRPGTALVTLEDRFEHVGRKHVYRWQQELTIGRSRRIEHIVHREVAAERAALDAFLEEVGVHR